MLLHCSSAAAQKFDVFACASAQIKGEERGMEMAFYTFDNDPNCTRFGLMCHLRR